MTYLHTPHFRHCIFLLASHLILYFGGSQHHCTLHPSIRQCWKILGAVTPGWEGHAAGIATLWTVAHQAPLPRGFSRQEYWSGLPCPPPGDLPNPGSEPVSLMSPELAGMFFTIHTTWDVQNNYTSIKVFLKKYILI